MSSSSGLSPEVEALFPSSGPYSCGHLPEGICDGCLEARLEARTEAPTVLYFLANYHTGEIVEIHSLVPDWFIDELTAIGGYVRFDTLDAAHIFFSACKRDEEECSEVDELISKAGDDRRERKSTAPMRYLEDFVARCANDCVEGR